LVWDRKKKFSFQIHCYPTWFTSPLLSLISFGALFVSRSQFTSPCLAHVFQYLITIMTQQVTKFFLAVPLLLSQVPPRILSAPFHSVVPCKNFREVPVFPAQLPCLSRLGFPPSFRVSGFRNSISPTSITPVHCSVLTAFRNPLIYRKVAKVWLSLRIFLSLPRNLSLVLPRSLTRLRNVYLPYVVLLTPPSPEVERSP